MAGKSCGSMKLVEIIKKNQDLADNLKGDKYSIAVLSNIMVSQIKDILELSIREEGIYADVTLGNYNNIVQDSSVFANTDMVIVFFDLINIIESDQGQLLTLGADKLTKLKSKIIGEIEMILSNLKSTPLVLFNCLTSVVIEPSVFERSDLLKLSEEINLFLSDTVNNDQVLVDINKILCTLGLNSATDMQNFYTSKSLYTVDFFKAYVSAINPLIMSVNGKAKKVLVLDCDNTLWGGTLGEDGIEGICMNEDFLKKGGVFKEVQSLFIGMKRDGVILALCSKNNPDDVDDVLINHKDCLLSIQDFAVKKVNWNNKASNISEISKTLNIGLDSIVFIDDSSFEIDLINSELPEVKCIQVPENIFLYPAVVKKVKDLFYSLSNTEEDSSKTRLYLEEVDRNEKATQFDTIDAYLSSLGLEVTIQWSDDINIKRVSQLSQKTNQFNLTTKRYTEKQIGAMNADDLYTIGMLSVSDKFGKYGKTGVVIIKNYKDESFVEIDSLLMSCRIIGRNVELVFMDEIIRKLNKEKIKTIRSSYIYTSKNAQVYDFYDNNGFNIISMNKNNKEYEINILKYKSNNIDYIEVRRGGE
jgi:FkbH-like protein